MKFEDSRRRRSTTAGAGGEKKSLIFKNGRRDIPMRYVPAEILKKKQEMARAKALAIIMYCG